MPSIPIKIEMQGVPIKIEMKNRRLQVHPQSDYLVLELAVLKHIVMQHRPRHLYPDQPYGRYKRY